MTRIAVFISPHGFGHAARSAAIVNELAALVPALDLHLFTTVPAWFFEESLVVPFTIHCCECDVGLVQATPLAQDPQATVARLEASPWADPSAVAELASWVGGLGCELVVADISPLGLKVAARAGLPSVLVENFTWSWIYDRMPEAPPALRALGQAMNRDTAGADLRIAGEPRCEEPDGAVLVPPIARAPRNGRSRVRQALSIPDDEPMVLASMGGVPWDWGPLEGLAATRARIVVPGGADVLTRRGSLILLPFHSLHYHPDLVAAADVVVGKLGYSTVAEVWRAGAALAYVTRPGFAESPVLARFADSRLNALEIGREAFATGAWTPAVEQVLARGRRPRGTEDGARAAAAAIVARFPRVFG